jgi:uncharacterized membrane protein YfcA
MVSTPIIEGLFGSALLVLGLYLLRRRRPLTEPAVRRILQSRRWLQWFYPLRFDRTDHWISGVRVFGLLAILVGLAFLVSLSLYWVTVY